MIIFSIKWLNLYICVFQVPEGCREGDLFRVGFDETGEERSWKLTGGAEEAGKKTHIFLRCHLILKVDRFTKTGSGHT
jgi:hypothetical protein